MACCENNGPGYATPLDAMNNGPKEKLLYVPAVVPDHSRPDYLATIDVDVLSPTYSQVIFRTPLAKGDELHHSGWNACSSCHGNPNASRNRLILPALGSSRVYVIDTASNPREPKVAATVEAKAMHAANVAYLHSTHCLGSGEILISCMGTPNGEGKGSFILLDQELKTIKRWTDEETRFGYDVWYQPRLNVMISSGWGAPKAFSKGFNPAEVEEHYGSTVYVWDWNKRKVVQELALGADGLVPLEVRFLHEPSSPHAFVCAALSSNMVHITRVKAPEDGSDGPGEWGAKVVFKQEWTQVEGWILPQLPPLITDFVISLDDRWLYLSNWLRGDIVQLDITDPEHPVVKGRVFVGGLIRKGSPVKAVGGLPDGVPDAPEVPDIKGTRLEGGPQMIQLSLDGRRLYVTNSLYSVWDKQFYPDLVSRGSALILVDVDNVHGGLTVNPNFLVDFGKEPDGPVLAHEVRYPGGDCTSDIWL